MGIGDTFDVGVVNGPAGKATITALCSDSMGITAEWGAIPPLPPSVFLLVGMCRPGTARKIITTVPTLGVRGIIFAQAGRSDPAYAESSLWKTLEWQELLIKGTEQAFNTHLPELHVCDDMQSATGLLSSKQSHLVALDVYEGACSLGSISFKAADSVCLAIGPERGWNTNDRAVLRDCGFQLVSLGSRVMRVETAATVGLALVLSGMGKL